MSVEKSPWTNGWCSVADADCLRSGRLRRGMCERHYRRMHTHGHTGRTRDRSPLEQFTSDDQGCWLWTGALSPHGYGKLGKLQFDTRTAHVAVYILLKGEYDRSLDLDHLCRVRRCVNPDHLEPVTRTENLLRGMQSGARDVCDHGHDLTQPDAFIPSLLDRDGRHHCRKCWKIRYTAAGKRYRDRMRDGSSG